MIRAHTKHAHPEQKGVVHVCEFQLGELFRTITFPKTIDPDVVTAQYRNGLLRVTAAIAAEKPARKVDIEPA